MQIARLLFEGLFDITIEKKPEGPTGVFLERWRELEYRVCSLVDKNFSRKAATRAPIEHLLRILREKELISDEDQQHFESLLGIRNSVVHGFALPGLDAGYIIRDLNALINKFPDWKQGEAG